ncbi:hypothetical protein [Shimia haliotis]|uniref:Uncharacterized protein n=1 Tax=Shimia haliotis TaxID=1280847 RepID=A0A1I4FQ24_9RHOB|nr:hypothetical protein [Shimia haliotis]SFL19559.1 hypothetical protein SAMN04488036_106191 [Shimia haliotis]
MTISFRVFSLISALLIGSHVDAQVSFDAAENRSFASENAILDTAIPFAIGAREAQQALRGSFGWPNFQEGLVEGVYFRFDPDGYARFAPTPRLDRDVFEVICRPRTYSCAARKEGFEMFLTERGQIQLKLENVAAGDTFHVVEGVSEIQVPERIVQPLDMQLEMLLGSGGELSARRGGNEISRVSLKGFAAVSSYLRWIVARQDYSVLPRGWPVPNGADAATTSMTQSAGWASPMPQPQALAPTVISQASTLIAPVETTAAKSEAEGLRAEIDELKRMMLQDRAGPDPDPVSFPSAGEQMPAPADNTSGQVAELLQTIAALQADLRDLKQQDLPTQESGSVSVPTKQEATDAIPLAESNAAADRLRFLMDELGLDMQTAVAVLQMSPSDDIRAPEILPMPTERALETETAVAATNTILYQTDVVDQILAELEADIAQPQMPKSAEAAAAVSPTIQEYQLLSRYFASAALPALRDFAAKQ